MNTQAQADERQALNANDVHVSTEQLNEAIKRAAEQGLRVEHCVNKANQIELFPTNEPEIKGQLAALSLRCDSVNV